MSSSTRYNVSRCKTSSMFTTTSRSYFDFGERIFDGSWEWPDPVGGVLHIEDGFLEFEDLFNGIPAGSTIDSAYLALKQSGGGYSRAVYLDMTFHTGAWYAITNANEPPNSGAPTKQTSLYGTTAGTRWFDLTTQLQYLWANSITANILKVGRRSRVIDQLPDYKLMGDSLYDHYILIGYTPPPTAPTIGTAARVTDTQATVTWTLGTNQTSHNILRSTDGGEYVQIQTGVSSTAESWTDTTVTANHRYAYKVVGVNGAGTATSDASNTIYMTPSAPTIGTTVKTGAATATANWTDNSNSEAYFEIERRVDGGTPVSLSATIPADSEDYDDTSVPGGDIEYRVRALVGALYSSWSSWSNVITTAQPPAAPTITSEWGTYVEISSALRLSWQHNTLDGSPQSGAYVYWELDGTPGNDTVSDDTPYYDIDVSGASVGDQIDAKVKTKGVDPSYGAYSDIASALLANLPTAVITTPAGDYDDITELPLAVAWSYSDDFAQAWWRLRLYDTEANLIEEWTGTTESSQSITAEYLENLSTFKLELVVGSATGLESDPIIRWFDTDYDVPTVPSGEATFDLDTLSATIIAQSGEVGANPATDHLGLARIDSHDGVTDLIVLTENLAEQSEFVDWLPRLDTTVTYRIMAFAASGVYSYVDVELETYSAGARAVNFGDGYAQVVVIAYDSRDNTGGEPDSEMYLFAQRPDPVYYAGSHAVESIAAAGNVFDDDMKMRARALRKNTGPCVYRAPDGVRANVAVRCTTEPLADRTGMMISLDMTVIE